AYLHLSRIPSGIRPGARVTQGDVVGYVGSTGLATGPHLDYRVQKNGRWIDPMGLDNVEAEALATAELPRFLAWRDALRVSLVSGEAPQPGPAGDGRDLRLAAEGGAPPGSGARPVPAAFETAG
ncbi:MAG TPA: M23 family metallopeptidase, partial [Thermoanaerobaculia bacterium]